MVFQYRIPRGRTFQGGPKPQLAKEEEVLYGVLQGKKVPKDEERFFKAAMKTGKVMAYYVQFELGHRGLPGYRTLDALVNTNMGWRAFEIDGAAFVHRGAGQKAQDRLSDLQRLDALKNLGINVRMGIEHVQDYRLTNQEQADRTVRELL